MRQEVVGGVAVNGCSFLLYYVKSKIIQIQLQDDHKVSKEYLRYMGTVNRSFFQPVSFQ